MAQEVRLRPRRGLTASQELIWTSQRLHPESPLQNMAIISRLGGAIDVERFVEAVDDVVAASDALRTTVNEVDGVPHPAIAPMPPRSTEVIDLAPDALDRWMDERIAAPLDLSTCAYDSVLIRHGDDDWSWWMNVHHLATDAASSALIFRAVADVYHGEWTAGGSYEALAEHLEQERSTPRWQRARDHWLDRGRSAPEVVTSLYGPDRGVDTRAERVWLPADPDRQRRLDALLADRFRLLSPDLSLTAALATALAVHLHRMGNERIVIGMPVHHRSGRRTRGVIGPLVELFPVEVEVRADDTFASVHQRVSDVVFDVLRHALPGTSPRQSFDVVLNVHAATFGGFGDLPTTSRWIPSGHIDSHHRLRVQALDYDGSGRLEICLDLNHRAAAADHRRRAGAHFAAVIDTMLDDPDAGVGSFGLLESSEQLLLDAFAAPMPATPLDAPAPVVVRHRLRHHAGRPAISCGGVTLDATEVDARIDEVAAMLGRLGIGRGDLVAIEMPLGIDAVVALHAVLRRGAAFVPIDPAYPDARRAHLRDDSGARLTITDLDDVRRRAATITPVEESPPEPIVELDDLAYVIYTSGSTGLPKGVPITHRGLAEYLGFAHATYVDTPDAVMPLFTSLSFDLTITTLFLPFLSGGLMTIHPEGGLPALRQIVDESRATMLKATPSHLELLARMIEPSHPLRTLIVGGEAFTTDLADRLHEALGPDAALHNEYGPTEAVVGCMDHAYDPATDPGPEVPIGRPAPGVGLRIVDRYGYEVPLGVAGELLIGRPGMTAGYLGRPDLTADKFLEADGRRWYRSGDLVRMADADTMIYLGRIDHQIKVGGIRLEPGEIEATALAVDGVRRAVAGLWSPDLDHPIERCVRCGLGDDVPGIVVDGDGVCTACHDYDVVAPQADAWFRTEDDLGRELADARDRSIGDYDVLHLLSGGKDSTYALHRLVEMGARVLAITLDNGFIADVAKDNVRRATARLGVDHEFVTVDAMNEIFRDSLERYSNVCNGCYKAIYTIALERATALGIPAIVTGLSRGQFFETRLVPGMFAADRFDPDAIDAAVVEARRVYHATPDAVSETMDTSFIDDETFDRIRFIDFYRYVDVPLADMYRALESTGIWERPPDSGRSTNCLINAAGIHVHTMEQGHHNYALPYSWDVRLGHKTRDEALEELDDPMGPEELSAITSMLAEVGYEPRRPEVLTLWIEADDRFDHEALERALDHGLPDHARPRAIELVDEIPLSPNGKVDQARLPAPSARQVSHGTGRAPVGETEERIAEVWSAVLGVIDLHADDDFFALGGTSLHALEMVVRLSEATGTAIPETLAFRHRTIAELAAAIGELAAGPAPDTSIPALADGDRPLSPGEDALLYEWRRDPLDRRYNVARLYRVPASLDRDRFDEAVRRVAAHQPVLHTSYGPDRRDLDVDEALRFGRIRTDASVDAIADTLNQAPFDLVNGPILTCHHLDAHDPGAPGTAAVLLRTHHIVSDAGSLDVLWSQIDAAYRGEPLPELPATYAEHGAWLRARTDDPFTAWPVDADHPPAELRLRSTAPEADGYVHRVSAIQRASLADGPGTTLFATALTAVAATMRPYHDGDRFELAVTSSVRDHPAVADLVGYFLNPLPLLVTVEPETIGVALARATSDTLADALTHRAVPFAALVRHAREHGLPAPTSRVMLAVEDLAPATIDGHPVDHRILSSGVAVNDLTFFVQIRDELIELGVEYRGAVVSRARADELLGELEATLSRLLRRPEERLLPDTVGEPIVGPVLDTDPILAPHRIVKAIAERGDAPAVRSGDRRLDHAELDATARALAGRLRAVGVAPGDRVAIVLPRSAELPAAVLATWYVGASYVPIDVSQPSARVTELVTAAGVVAAISTGDGHLGLTEVTTVLADRNDPAVLPITTPHDWRPDDEAYVIFTSGSTGTPKGVPIDHGNLAASLAARLQWYGEPVRRYLLLSSAGFDSSVAGLFWAMADGGELIIPSESEAHDVDALLALIERTTPTHMLCVPSLYAGLLARRGAALPGLEVVIVAGEACPSDLVARHRRTSPGVDLVNEYGPTEATVWATAHRCEPADASNAVPIGRPIPGVTAHVLDGDGRQVPPDVAGELVLTGPTVAAGYLDADDGRAFTEIEGERAYRTGDLVVGRRSGVIDYLGRVDDQLSVGGVRIEPIEIEHVVASLDGVGAAAVGVVGRDLIAWIEADGDVGSAALREQLFRRLPPTHVPARVVGVDRLPRNPNGKIDRAALSNLPAGATTARPDAADPDPLTQRMIDLWSRVFDGAAIDADTDFFEAGGDSLRAVELVGVLEAEYGRRVGIGELIDAPTPRRLAGHVTAASRTSARGGASTSTLVEWLRSTGDGPPLVVLPPGGGNLLRYEPLVRALPSDVPVLGIRLPGADARSEIADTIDEQARLMLDALDSVVPGGPYRLLGWSTGGLIAWDMARRLRRRGDEVELVALVDTVMGGMHVDPPVSPLEKYRTLLRSGGPSAVVAEASGRISERSRFAVARARYRAARRLDRTPSLADAERQLGPVIRRASLSYRPAPLDVPMVYFSASESDNALTVDPWTEVQGVERIRVVEIEGVHFLPEERCIIGPARVDELVSELPLGQGAAVYQLTRSATSP